MLFIAIISKTFFLCKTLTFIQLIFFLQILIMSHDLIETNLKNLFFLQTFILYFCIIYHIVIGNCFFNNITGPLDPNLITGQDKYINDLWIKYRTYYVEYDVNEGGLTFSYYISHLLYKIFFESYICDSNFILFFILGCC
jgi:hypothetical protein